MATSTIETIKRKTGTKYKARIRLTRKGKKLYEESKTFDKRTDAKKWAAETLENLKTNGIPNGSSKSKTITIGDLITLYMNDPVIAPTIGRSKHAVLSRLRTYPLALLYSHEIQAYDLIKHCKMRQAEDSCPQPQTIYHDITYLKSVLDVANAMFGYKANTQAHHEAIPSLIHYGLIGRSNQRDRRPTPEELRIMEEGLLQRQQHHASHIPLVDIFHVSINTCMRVSEITKLRWDDFNSSSATLTVRNRKNPRNKIGNNTTIPLDEKTKEIILRQPRVNDLIFPVEARSITAAWQRVAKAKGIKDLRYHDLRSEGACRLFERGLDVVQISKITGHRDINVLNNIYLRLGVEAMHKR
ncbi:tyrosine-type recombinase/integrase [Vibrio sp. 10N.261.49.A5]|uniref:Integrase n=1 Tax=Vibrio tasmaniensis 1F-267 TaxID=1191324 RepID=A0ABX3B693_9VIBR|nr:site-specific integrase [Vibrio tasmaniensis]OEF47920.1 integrase [Vibrio tasmaniensis 1F-267]